MNLPTAARIEGVVLCRVGDDRLAVRAQEIVSFEMASPDALYAGARFHQGSTVPAEPRALRVEAGVLLVDSVEVLPEALPMMRVPPSLERGALIGFIEAMGLLWPVVSVERLLRGAPT